MNHDPLSDRSMDFAISVLSLVKELRASHEMIVSLQIGRSGTSIGANIREARYAQSTADFISKMQIALKEAAETGYWLELLFRSGYLGQTRYSQLSLDCTELIKLLTATVNTAKKNNAPPPVE